MSKGAATRARILESAMTLASRVGLSGLSIGALAEELKLSKSGLFAHFGSKEALQVAVLEHTRARFGERMAPGLKDKAPGLASLVAFMQGWFDWVSLAELPSGCPAMGAIFEFEVQEGAPRQALVLLLHLIDRQLVRELETAVKQGELRPLEPARVAFQLRGLVLALHQELHLMRNERARDLAESALADLLTIHRAP